MSAPHWMVLGRGAPTVRHSTRAKAQAEAERLARKEPGLVFVVLQAVAEVVQRPQPVEVKELGAPFMDDARLRGWRSY